LKEQRGERGDSRISLRKDDFIDKYKQLNVFKKNKAEFGGLTAIRKQTRNSQLSKPALYSSLPHVGDGVAAHSSSKLPERDLGGDIRSWEVENMFDLPTHKHSRAHQSQIIN